MANLSALAPITSGATTATNVASQLAGIILVTPNTVLGYAPQDTPQAQSSQITYSQPAFLFNFEGEQRVSIRSDITDHYVEDNTAIQDQIALAPEKISSKGYIGELNDIAPLGLQTVQKLANTLTTLSGYTPALSQTALIAYNTAFQLYQIAANAVNTAVSAYSSITGNGGETVIGSTGLIGNGKGVGVLQNQNKQQTAFQTFYGYWRKRQLFTVQTPWAVFQNMAIEAIDTIQDENNQFISEFNVTFKMIRFANTAVGTPQILGGQLFYQAQPLSENGTSAIASSPSVDAAGMLGSSGLVA